jgi:hypothetical protein
MRIVMDGDSGSDDAIAMLVAIGAPEIQLVGITTVGGNAAVADVTDNALRLVKFLGAETPVYAGSAEPIDGRGAYGSEVFTTRDRRRAQVAGLNLPAAKGAQAGHAVDFLIDCFASSGGEDVTLIATGPLTNLARALDRKPALREAIPHLILMGGAHDSGNVTASAEFNFWADPVAAKAVFDAHLADVVMFPARRHPLGAADARRLRAVRGGRRGAWPLRRRVDSTADRGGRSGRVGRQQLPSTRPAVHRPGAGTSDRAIGAVFRRGRSRRVVDQEPVGDRHPAVAPWRGRRDGCLASQRLGRGRRGRGGPAAVGHPRDLTSQLAHERLAAQRVLHQPDGTADAGQPGLLLEPGLRSGFDDLLRHQIGQAGSDAGQSALRRLALTRDELRREPGQHDRVVAQHPISPEIGRAAVQ